MIDIIPGINEENFEEVRKKIELVRDFVRWIHIDIADDTLVSHVTNREWGGFMAYNGIVKFEAHLMVSDPMKYIEPLVANGFDRLVAHVEAETTRDFITEVRRHEVEVGMAIDGPSQLESVEPFLDQVDSVLVMMYKAGASGKIFEPQQLTKVKKIHEEYLHLPIEVDGGINRETAPLATSAGATRLVSTSFLFWKNKDRVREAIEELRG